MYQRIFISQHSLRPEYRDKSFQCFRLQLGLLIGVDGSLSGVLIIDLRVMRFSSSFQIIFIHMIILVAYFLPLNLEAED